MGGLTKTSPTYAALTADLSLQECDDLLTTGMCNIRDSILGYTEHGLTQPHISDRVTNLGFKASVRTIKRHVADLRDEGLLPAMEPSQNAEAVRQRRHRESVTKGHFDPMSQPYQEPPQPTVLNHTLNEKDLAPAASQYCLQAEDARGGRKCSASKSNRIDVITGNSFTLSGLQKRL